MRARKRRGRSPLLPKYTSTETAPRRDATESAGTAERHDHDDRERTRRGTETARRRRGGGKDDQDDTGTAKGRSTFDEGRIEGDSILSSDLPWECEVRSFAIIIVFTCIFVGLNTVVVVVVVVVVSLIRLRILTLIILILIAAARRSRNDSRQIPFGPIVKVTVPDGLPEEETKRTVEFCVKNWEGMEETCVPPPPPGMQKQYRKAKTHAETMLERGRDVACEAVGEDMGVKENRILSGGYGTDDEEEQEGIPPPPPPISQFIPPPMPVPTSVVVNPMIPMAMGATRMTIKVNDNSHHHHLRHQCIRSVIDNSSRYIF